MNNEPNNQQPEQPVAYDNLGRPLYGGQQAAPQAVYTSRPIEPAKPQLSPEARERHEKAKKMYPDLNLSEGEYVISSVRRHPIGLLSIWLFDGFAIAVIFGLLLGVSANPSFLEPIFGQLPDGSLTIFNIVLLLVSVMFFVGAAVATYVYNNNRFFLTNESVIQFIQTGLFSRNVQTISLINIEDASYSKKGIMQTALNYGSLRLSTEGDETTYRFNWVANPHQQINLLNDAIEAFKNGRPVLND